jgi:hypothetical protein
MSDETKSELTEAEKARGWVEKIDSHGAPYWMRKWTGGLVRRSVAQVEEHGSLAEAIDVVEKASGAAALDESTAEVDRLKKAIISIYSTACPGWAGPMSGRPQDIEFIKANVVRYHEHLLEMERQKNTRNRPTTKEMTQGEREVWTSAFVARIQSRGSMTWKDNDKEAATAAADSADYVVHLLRMAAEGPSLAIEVVGRKGGD